MLNTIIWLFVGILFSFAVGRAFKSNTMFWISLLCVLAGFMCGTIAVNIPMHNKNITVVDKSMPIQSSMSSLTAIYSEIEPYDTSAFAETVGKDEYHTFINLNYTNEHKTGTANPLLNYHDYVDTS